MRILDRYILKSFLVNYLLAFGVLVGMFILLDLIVNVSDFTRGANAGGTVATLSAWEIVRDMADYYMYQLLLIFQYVSGVIPLMAAGFTMVRMTRHHELTAMLASGVSLYRVAAPIVLASIAFSALHVINQEFVISRPAIIEKLMRKHQEVRVVTVKNEPLLFLRDGQALLSAKEYDAVNRQMKGVFIVERDENGMPLRHIVAPQANWELYDFGAGGGMHEAWVMPDALVEDDTGTQPYAGKNIYARMTSLTPEHIDLMLSKKAVDFLSSSKVQALAKASPEVNQPILYKIMHLRFTQPLMNIILLLIGIPFLLTREPNRLTWNMTYCFAIVGVVYAATFVIFQMGGPMWPPLLVAWLPVLIFAPLALVMTDLIRT